MTHARVMRPLKTFLDSPPSLWPFFSPVFRKSCWLTDCLCLVKMPEQDVRPHEPQLDCFPYVYSPPLIKSLSVSKSSSPTPFLCCKPLRCKKTAVPCPFQCRKLRRPEKQAAFWRTSLVSSSNSKRYPFVLFLLPTLSLPRVDILWANKRLPSKTRSVIAST